MAGAATIQQRLLSPWPILVAGVLAASVSGILVRYADGVHPLAISFWRCAAGAAFLAPFARKRFSRLRAVDLKLPAVAGVFLALHFATWIWSIGLTSIAASVLLVSTTPVFSGIAAWFLLKERLRSAAWVGIALALFGTGLIGGGDLSGSNLLGNALALLGGIAAAGYVLSGQVARQDLGLLEYAVVTYAVAAVALLIACLAAGADLLGYPQSSWWALLAIVVGPQLLGHTLINQVLRDIDATTVSVVVMVEPLIATWLAYVLFAEVPSALIYPGGVAVLIGMYLVSAHRREPAVIK
ncbi:MAG TPA: DMT family transporter [Actinomycetota bacterium]|nr:DMT family transporter [Actinomycetota bacterium]